MTSDHESDNAPRGIDWGLLSALLLFAAIPLAIWLLLASSGEAEPRRTSPPAAEIPEPARRTVPRARRGEAARLERDLEAAKRQLEQARIERAQDPSGTWDEIVEKHLREISELRQRLEELRGK